MFLPSGVMKVKDRDFCHMEVSGNHSLNKNLSNSLRRPQAGERGPPQARHQLVCWPLFSLPAPGLSPVGTGWTLQVALYCRPWETLQGDLVPPGGQLLAGSILSAHSVPRAGSRSSAACRSQPGVPVGSPPPSSPLRHRHRLPEGRWV